uniref:Uncharacterized protein n=1 Tax=Arundo donax TaxID=35708 RepID=A0A0A9CXV9_ARUDO
MRKDQIHRRARRLSPCTVPVIWASLSSEMVASPCEGKGLENWCEIPQGIS